MLDTSPVTLDGLHVQLKPLSLDHVPKLCKVGLDSEIWTYTLVLIRTKEEMQRYVESALRAQAEGTALPFATIEKKSGRVAGTTRFGSIESNHKRVEIGWSWLGKEFQRTPLNTEAKYLMLKHAFETWGCNRVEFKTDVLNENSRTALRRIGAKEEGILRRHMVTATGRARDSVYYSIVNGEWQAVKHLLEQKLSAHT